MSEDTPAPLIDLPSVPKGESAPRKALRYFHARRARFTALAALAAGAIAVGGHFLGGVAGIWEFYRIATGQAAEHGAASKNAPLMSVAVVPFSSASSNEESQRIADRLTRDVISAMERAMRFALVASYDLTAHSRAKSTDPRDLGRDLNVRYLVEGDIRDDAGAAVITVRLLETGSGRQVWSDRLTASKAGDNAVVVAQVANRLRPVLYQAEEKRASELGAKEGGALALVLRADASWDQEPTLKRALEVKPLYEQALARNPNSVAALEGLFYVVQMSVWEDPRHDHEKIGRELDELSLRAVRADKDDPKAWIARARALAHSWKWEGALEASAEALRIDPYRNTALGDRAALFILMGRPEEAFEVIDRAIALDPRGPAVPGLLHVKCWAHGLLAQYDEAIAACEKARALDDTLWILLVRLASAYANKGDMPKAYAMKSELVKRQPGISIARLAAWRVSDNPVFLQQRETTFFAGLRKVGIPEK